MVLRYRQAAAITTPQNIDASKLTWAADDLLEKDRFDFFRETICRNFLSFSPDRPAHESFSAKLQQTRFSSGCISKLDVTPHFARRTRADVARIPCEYIALNTHILGRNEIMIGDNKYNHSKDDISLVEGARITSIALEARKTYKSMSLIFDKANIQKSTNLKIPIYGVLPNSPQMRAIRTCLRFTAEQYDSSSASCLEQLFFATQALLCATLINDRDYLQHRLDLEPGLKNGISDIVKSIVETRLRDPGLSTASIAAELKMSVRYLQKIFSKEGITIKGYINIRRLQKIRSDLVAADRDNETVTEIAIRWGFRDMTTFYRNFKQYFDETPNRFRSAT